MDLTAENYYSQEANNEFLSASYVKAFMNCEAAAEAERRGYWKQETNTAMLVGSMVDAILTDDFSAFLEAHPEVRKKDGGLKADFVQAQQMAERALKDDFFRETLEGEHQKILTGEIGGLMFKAKLDCYVPGVRIVDLKTTKDMKPVYIPNYGRVDFATAWNWPLQLAIYRELEGNRLPCYLAVITKETPPDIAVIRVPDSRLDTEMEVLEARLPRIDAVRRSLVEPKRCGKCAYCRATKVLDGYTTLDEYEDGGITDE